MNTKGAKRLYLILARLLPAIALITASFVPVFNNSAQAQENPPPYFSVITNFQQVHGQHWPLGATLTLEIDDPDTLDNPDFTAETYVVEAPEDPGSETWFEFNLFEFDPDPVVLVKPGNIFTVTDGEGFSKTHTVEPLFVTDVDPVSKTIAGTAEPDSDVRVDPNPGEGTEVWETADINGNWFASNLNWDIQPSFGGDAIQYDGDGDTTQFQMRLPLIEASITNNWINLGDFNHNTFATVNIDKLDPAEADLTFEVPTDNEGHAWLNGGENGFDLEVGDEVMVTDGFSGLIKELILEDITLDDIDLDTDKVSGTAQPNEMLWVDVGNDFDGRGMDVTADVDGNWTADFTLHPEGIFDITWDMGTSARVFDEDFDATVAEPGPPFLHVVPYWPEVYGQEWPVGADVSMTIDDNSGNLLYTVSQVVQDPEFGPYFDLQGVFEIEPGMVVTMTDGKTTRTVEVSALAITEVNPAADTVSGTAQPGDVVQVDIHEIEQCVTRFAEVNGEGTWTVNFSESENTGDECQDNTFDLDENSHGRAIITTIRHWDNGTLAYWPRPRFLGGSLSLNPVEVNQPVNIEASFQGPITNIQFSFGDSDSWFDMEGIARDFDVFTGTAEINTFSEPGIYEVYVHAQDYFGNLTNQFLVGYLAVYDPEGGFGFVTGGGWFWSPPGAYAADLDLVGKANFGFVSEYKKGASIPSGQTEFQFQVADLNFHSSSYEWLVVNQGGTRAQFKGEGTINGSGEYKFMIWAVDGEPDTFRIKIWSEEGEVEDVVYDNRIDQEIDGGSIIVHTKK